MQSPRYIISSSPEQCVDFYTRVLGLALVLEQTQARVPFLQNCKPEDAPTATAGTTAQALAPAEHAQANAPLPAVFRIDNRSITLLSAKACRELDGHAGWNGAQLLAGSHAQDLYFLAHGSLDAVKCRIADARWEVVQGPVTRSGFFHCMRILHLLDPDGNRIRLVEMNG